MRAAWWVAGLVLLAGGAQDSEGGKPLASSAVRGKLRGVTGDVAETGDAELLARMRQVLAGLGDGPDELDKQQRAWSKSLAAAKPAKVDRAKVAASLRRELKPLVELLGRTPEDKRAPLARWILELDSEEPSANAALGYVQDGAGAWVTAEELTWEKGAEGLAELERAAAHLEPELVSGTSTNPALAALGGGGTRMSAGGIELHSGLAPEALERILTNALRAAALSNAVLRGSLTVPKISPRRYLLLDTPERYTSALDEAEGARGLTAARRAELRERNLLSFPDARGWLTVGYASEADFAALLLWDVVQDWLGADVTPCLRTGHLNWVTLRALGTSMPATAWTEVLSLAAGETSARTDPSALRQVLWRSARKSAYGCRAWMEREVREGRDIPWARTMLDQDGKIRDQLLLKTTLVCEFLTLEEKLWTLIDGSRKKAEPVPAFEALLGEPLQRFEDRWRRWLTAERRGGVVQALTHEATAVDDEAARAALLALNRARANALKDQGPEVPVVEIDAELSRAATAHARYLALNRDQLALWPNVHEELPDRPGFSAEGARAGANSLVHSGWTPELSVQQWLGTFYHRLPLLDPGLFAVGLGRHEDVVVLDVRSLTLVPWREHVVVWPLPDAEGVPCEFVSEIPNPVDAPETRGYPVTVQLFLPHPQNMNCELRVIDAQAREVEGTLLTPRRLGLAPPAPENAWCLIPDARLARKTRYTAAASWTGGSRTWSFTTE